MEHSLPWKEFVKKIGLVRDSWLGEGTAKWLKALPDDHPVSTWSPDPRHTHIFVAGGAGLEGQFYPNFSSESYVKTITKEIELPKNWDEVLEKANIVPTPMPKLPW